MQRHAFTHRDQIHQRSYYIINYLESYIKVCLFSLKLELQHLIMYLYLDLWHYGILLRVTI